MDDVEIDRALHATLSADPSPEFVARLRTKIAEAPRPSMRAGWLKPVGATACAAIVAIAVGWPRNALQEEREAQFRASPAEVTTRKAAAEAPAPSVAPVVVAPAGPKPAFKSAATTTPAALARVSLPNEPPFPEVLIAADDVEALRQFVSAARDRRFVATFEEAPTPTVWAMNDLAIAPITVEPLDSAQSHNN